MEVQIVCQHGLNVECAILSVNLSHKIQKITVGVIKNGSFCPMVIKNFITLQRESNLIKNNKHYESKKANRKHEDLFLQLSFG